MRKKTRGEECDTTTHLIKIVDFAHTSCVIISLAGSYMLEKEAYKILL